MLVVPSPARAPTPQLAEIGDWVRERLTGEDRAFVRSFGDTCEVALGGASLLCFHGSPRSNTDRVLPTTPDEQLSSLLGEHRATVLAGGHTHVQMLRPFGGILLVNPGTIGSPLRPGGAIGCVAEYALVEWRDGTLSVEFRRVPFDGHAALAAAIAAGMPHAQWWDGLWGLSA
ncbi:MAG: metallophosphoesterase family protein [Chloroflexi bacterium]|nr:metallophosphoesterase family protein [Chloroflexota bacterium]